MEPVSIDLRDVPQSDAATINGVRDCIDKIIDAFGVMNNTTGTQTYKDPIGLSVSKYMEPTGMVRVVVLDRPATPLYKKVVYNTRFTASSVVVHDFHRGKWVDYLRTLLPVSEAHINDREVQLARTRAEHLARILEPVDDSDMFLPSDTFLPEEVFLLKKEEES